MAIQLARGPLRAAARKRLASSAGYPHRPLAPPAQVHLLAEQLQQSSAAVAKLQMAEVQGRFKVAVELRQLAEQLKRRGQWQAVEMLQEHFSKLLQGQGARAALTPAAALGSKGRPRCMPGALRRAAAAGEF